MNTYDVWLQGIKYKIDASNKATAIRRALNSYYHDPDITPEARTSRRREIIGREMTIMVERIA